MVLTIDFESDEAIYIQLRNHYRDRRRPDPGGGFLAVGAAIG